MVINEILTYIEYDMTQKEACKLVWITEQTFINWKNKYEDVKTMYDHSKLQPFYKAKKTLISASNQWDWKASIEFLKRRDKTYKDKQEVENTWEEPIIGVEISIL